MQTQVMTDATAAPWLEYDALDGSGPAKATIESLPFTIGRSKTADLQLETTRVSREHAVIECVDGVYRVRDLQSTNGTFVNSKRTGESTLCDGDIVAVADCELVFCTGQTSASAATVTQVMGGESGSRSESVADVIRAVRKLQELVVTRAAPVLMRPIVDLTNERVWGHTAVDADLAADGHGAQLPPWLAKADCRAIERKRMVFCLLAAEQARRLPGSLHVFLPLTASEIAADLRIDFLARVAELLGAHRLIVEFPDSAAELPYVAEFVSQLRSAGLLTAFEGLSACDRADCAPDFLKLPRAALAGAKRGEDRRKQLRNWARAGSDAGCRLVATGVASSAEAEECRELGCHFAEGPLFGGAAPVENTRPAGRGRAVAAV